jgi:DNA polymerase III subunit gamma/tau
LALDTKYRPLNYEDVLGQDASVSVLRQFIKEGRGFHQSYVFCGQHGSGKTTLGRILARALLCSSPVDGAPCNECHSCKVFLNGGTHESFEELDAATKSGKNDLARIVENVTYSTFSGKRRIYLFDESHRLSKQALDALLKPMEDNVEGSEDKKLVCIFCTTEPEKMRSTIFSRCAPAFVIRAVSPEGIAGRLAWVCEKEGVECDEDALVTIAEVSECHIRDALKTVEGVSMLGAVTRENVFRYLQLGANDKVLGLLESLGRDLKSAIEISNALAVEVSPSSAYERISEAALCAYQYHLGITKIPSQWSKERITALSERGHTLLSVASRFSAPPHRPSKGTLSLDVGAIHLFLTGKNLALNPQRMTLEVTTTPRVETQASKPKPTGTIDPVAVEKPAGSEASNGFLNGGGVWVDPRAISGVSETTSNSGDSDHLSPEIFQSLFRHHLKGLMRGKKGSTR